MNKFKEKLKLFVYVYKLGKLHLLLNYMNCQDKYKLSLTQCSLGCPLNIDGKCAKKKVQEYIEDEIYDVRKRLFL